jgi:hypothetical protein
MTCQNCGQHCGSDDTFVKYDYVAQRFVLRCKKCDHDLTKGVARSFEMVVRVGDPYEDVI